jgi:hypothetical protein
MAYRNLSRERFTMSELNSAANHHQERRQGSEDEEGRDSGR